MKVALLSDPHFTVENPIGRNDNIESAVISKLLFVRDYLVQRKIRYLLVAGDLCDVKRSWNLLSLLTTHLSDWVDKGIEVFAVLGQHDSYYHETENDSTVLGVLMSAGLITRLTDDVYVISDKKETVFIQGASYGEPVPEAFKAPTKKGTSNILVIHKMIGMARLWAQQQGMEYAPAFLKRNKGYDLILCGDAHRRFIHSFGRRIICNTGPVIRLEATEEMMEYRPALFVYDTKVPGRIGQIPIPCRNNVLTREHIEKIQEEKADFDAFINEMLEKGRSRYTFNYILRRYLEKQDGIVANEGVKKILSEVMGNES